MNLEESLKLYGQGDNSTTDRMWYEDACEICLGVYNMWEHNEEDYCANKISEFLKNKANDGRNFEHDGLRIYNRMISGGTSFVSRITIEYVRQQIEKLLK